MSRNRLFQHRIPRLSYSKATMDSSPTAARRAATSADVTFVAVSVSFQTIFCTSAWFWVSDLTYSSCCMQINVFNLHFVSFVFGIRLVKCQPWKQFQVRWYMNFSNTSPLTQSLLSSFSPLQCNTSLYQTSPHSTTVSKKICRWNPQILRKPNSRFGKIQIRSIFSNRVVLTYLDLI
jgi:hypothetical protein